MEDKPIENGEDKPIENGKDKPGKKHKRKGERKDGLIPIYFDVGRKPDGSRDRKVVYGHTRPEALQKKKDFLEQWNKGTTVDPNITVSEWVEIVKSTYRSNVNPLHLAKDSVPYDRLVKAIGKKRVCDIRESDLQKAYNEVADMSFSTVSKYGIAIKKVFNKARKNKIITDDPSEDIVMPPYTKGTHRSLERWEVDLILANWYNRDARIGIWIMLMLFCGLRRSEMMALRWERIDMDARKINVCEVAVIHGNQSVVENRAKTKAGERVLPMPRLLFEALSTIPSFERSGLVCTSAKGKQLSDTAIVRGVEKFCTVMTRIANNEPTNKLGMRTDLMPDEPKPDRIIFEFRLHDLRHTYATMLYDAGVPVKAAQYFLGHADIKITIELYTHLSKEREKLSRASLIQYFDNWMDNRVIDIPETQIDFEERVLNFEPWQ